MSDTVSIGDVPIATDGLDPARVHAILDQRTRDSGRLARRRIFGPTVIACEIGGERFGMPILAVAEVLPVAVPTPVPGAPPALLGLVPSRGVVFNLFDPAVALGLAPGPGAHMLVLRGRAPRLALRVTAAIGTVRLAAEAPAEVAGLTETVLTADGDRLGLIAMPKLIEALGVGHGAGGD